MNFIGREKELKKLKKIVDSDELSVALIYGRRRIGKSELVKQLLRKSNKQSIYYECKQVSEMSNVAGICGVLSEAFNLPKLGFTDIESVLDYIFKESEKTELIFVIDEYPYLKSTVKGIDSIIQSLIDKYKSTSNITVILLGSYVEIMKSLLEHSNPLYGRIDLSINLKQMDYYDSSLFYPSFSSDDKVRLYSVFGGIPYYNRLIDESKSVKQNIIELIASEGARLENEVSVYLKAEISKVENANEVFGSLAKGFSKYSDILSQSCVSSGPTLVDVLDKLIKMEVVEKTTPINEKNNKKRVSYHISDNLSSFYYRYVFRYSSQLAIMDSDDFYEKYISKDFEEQYVPHKFEVVCKQYLIRKNKNGQINPVFEDIGKYYYDHPKEHTNGEFDVVTKDEHGYIFYEAKFRKSQVTEKMIEDEIKQVKATGLGCYKYVFFSKSGFAAIENENIILIDINEMYNQM